MGFKVICKKYPFGKKCPLTKCSLIAQQVMSVSSTVVNEKIRTTFVRQVAVDRNITHKGRQTPDFAHFYCDKSIYYIQSANVPVCCLLSYQSLHCRQNFCLLQL